MIGVEAGLDSNGRKNRGGHAMENITEFFIKDWCQKNDYKYIKEANSTQVKRMFGKTIPVDKASRRFDFVICTKSGLVVIETNFYSGGGSKLKSTAGEYKELYNLIGKDHKFVWITDGEGWKTASLPLRETFEHNDYIFSLKMLECGILSNM